MCGVTRVAIKKDLLFKTMPRSACVCVRERERERDVKNAFGVRILLMGTSENEKLKREH